MLKQMKKILSVLLVICFLMSVTAAVVSAEERREHRVGYGEHREVGHGEHADWGWGNDYSHHHWWHGQYYPNCDWVLSPTNQWVWVC
jgi:hypothetical protein